MQWENVRMNINILGLEPAELNTIPKYTLYIFKNLFSNCDRQILKQPFQDTILGT